MKMIDRALLKDGFDAIGGIEGIKKGVSSVSSFFSRGKKESDKLPAHKVDNFDNSLQSNLYSLELERLISLILENDEVSDREWEMLKARAEKEGVDPLEFELVIKKRLKKKKEETARLKNPVVAMSEAFKIVEATAKGEAPIDGVALSGVLSLIPGVGQVAAIGGLASSLIKTPSNLNVLKAEIIANATIPEEEAYLSDFLLFCHSQKEMDLEKRSSDAGSVSRFISSKTVGNSIDLVPIWNTKINHLIGRARTLFPESKLLEMTISQVYESPATFLRKEKSRNKSRFKKDLEGLMPPEDDQELLEVIAFLHENIKDDDDIRNAHKRFYKTAECRFNGNEELLRKLKLYKAKIFGIF